MIRPKKIVFWPPAATHLALGRSSGDVAAGVDADAGEDDAAGGTLVTGCGVAEEVVSIGGAAVDSCSAHPRKPEVISAKAGRPVPILSLLMKHPSTRKVDHPSRRYSCWIRNATGQRRAGNTHSRPRKQQLVAQANSPKVPVSCHPCSELEVDEGLNLGGSSLCRGLQNDGHDGCLDGPGRASKRGVYPPMGRTRDHPCHQAHHDGEHQPPPCLANRNQPVQLPPLCEACAQQPCGLAATSGGTTPTGPKPSET